MNEPGTHMATVIGGHLQLDDPLPLPDNSRVNVVVSAADVKLSKASALQAFQGWLKYLEDHPVDSGGVRFTREELHERRPTE